MGYLDTVHTLLNDPSVDSAYYVKVHSLLTHIHQGKYTGDQNIIVDLDQFNKIRDKKISEGRSTKSVLSATDSQVYVFNTIWKRIARKELLDSTLDRANFLLDHLTSRADKKDVNIAKGEYQIIDQLRDAMEAGTLDMELLKSPKIATFLEDINPYKNLEGYLKDPTVLAHKTKSRWRQELPLLFMVLGIDPELFTAYLENDSAFLSTPLEKENHDPLIEERTDHDATKPTFWQQINELPSWLKVLVLVLITTGTVYILLQMRNPAEASEKSITQIEDALNVVEKPLESSKIFSPFSPITSMMTSSDSLILQVNQIESEEVLSGEKEVPVQAVELEVRIQNTSRQSGYVFEGLQITTLQSYKVGGQVKTRGIPRNNAQLEEIAIDCSNGAVLYRTIINESRSVLIPQQETVCSLKLELTANCDAPEIGQQVVPLIVGFLVQNVKDNKAGNHLVQLKEPIAIAIQ